jgi:hypothetical protein
MQCSREQQGAKQHLMHHPTRHSNGTRGHTDAGQAVDCDIISNTKHIYAYRPALIPKVTTQRKLICSITSCAPLMAA